MRNMDEIMENIKQEIYSSNNLVNGQQFKDKQEELERIGEYLPYHIRQLIGYNYYYHLRDEGLLEKILEQESINKYNTPEEQFNELKEWINKHPSFKNIMNMDEVRQIEQRIKKIE